MPIATMAQQHAAVPASRPAPQPAAYHAAPVYHAEPVYHAAPTYHAAPAYRAEPAYLPAPPVSHAAPPGNPGGLYSAAWAHPAIVPSAPPYRSFHGPMTYNPYRWNRWGWNRGFIWYPVHIYWGGGFWGRWGLSMNNVAPYGAITDDRDSDVYPSYAVDQGSPGAQLLVDYGLTQTQCGPPNLVVIWGPDNSVICAYPNDLVSAGNYELDPATLSLQSL